MILKGIGTDTILGQKDEKSKKSIVSMAIELSAKA